MTASFTKMVRNSLVAATVMAFAATLAQNCSAQAPGHLLGQSAAGWTGQQQTHQVAAYHAPVQIRQWYVISVTTYVQNATGNRTAVTWDFTTHIKNNRTGVFEPQQWGRAYLNAAHGLTARGWQVVHVQSHSFRPVTGSW